MLCHKLDVGAAYHKVHDVYWNNIVYCSFDFMAKANKKNGQLGVCSIA